MSFKKSIKYPPKLWEALLFLFLIVLSYVLFAGRKEGIFRFEFFEWMMPSFYSHISNFSLSFILMMTMGFIWSMMGIKFSYVFYVACLIVGLNFIYEMFLSLLNTKDIIDAFFGTAGVGFAIVFLLLFFRFGRKTQSNPSEPDI